MKLLQFVLWPILFTCSIPGYSQTFNIFWINGGDTTPNATSAPILRALASGANADDGGRFLMTYHPLGPSCSGDFFQSRLCLNARRRLQNVPHPEVLKELE